MKTISLSHPLSRKTPLYGGKLGIGIEPAKSMVKGDSSNSFNLSFHNHSSTHIDLPYHFFSDGKKISDFDNSYWFFKKIALIEIDAHPGELIDFDPKGSLSAEDREAEILLLRTGFEKYREEPQYWSQNPGLASALAPKLKGFCPNLRTVGVDVISISSPLHREEGRKAHREFLGLGISLIEDMKLSGLSLPLQFLIVAPLLVEGVDAAPVNVMAFKNMEMS